jgi:hypothetical protein
MVQIKGLRTEYCMKCGEEVKPANNADYWDTIYHALCRNEEPMGALTEYLRTCPVHRASRARHLYPNESCDGTPELVAMIEDGLYTHDLGNKLKEPITMHEDDAKNAKKAYDLLRNCLAAKGCP